ncbi:hypothetical protein FZEAL_8696 [Fusarium zealandicum]|uniref:Peptidase A1 domain-containing protein n=1 Tax=Fusarium zealandicum TaxID=1053134 RepID=A0A8H4UEA4_9HYPO|nr:hypothetical protein FZEAL_8696 [Fusarium zealandicum]
MWSSFLGTSLFLVGVAQARDPAPVLLPPSNWKGVDGNWSTISFSLGSQSEAIDVLVSTALSEFWAVGSGGCLPHEPHCGAARGGIYEPDESTDWDPLGTWQLGLDYLEYGGNGEYGLDRISTQSPTSDQPYVMDGVLVAAINTTNYLNGFFGLGITQGKFDGRVAESPLTQAVKQFGWIPSYSFGYTAGAHYRNSPVSLSLGGVDKSRFRAHNNDFTLEQNGNMELALVRGIEITPAEGQDAPDNWENQSSLLSGWNTSFEVIIDSTTPYLWLPDEVCDKFAEALNLTYNSTFDLYTITNDQYRAYSKQDTFSFTFVLSSFDNNDNFGDPYAVSGVVNITVPLRAFVSLLQYPFMQETVRYGDPAVPYLMLRKAHNSSTYILGRSFLQESYLVTKYDQGVFSIHQALFPDNLSDDTDLTPNDQPDNSPYPGPSTVSHGGLSQTQVMRIGVGVGVGVACVVFFLGWLCYRRKRKNSAKSTGSLTDDDRQSDSKTEIPSPRSPLMQLISKITRRGNSAWSQSTKSSRKSEEISEAPNTQIYELPAPIPPAELDGEETSSWNGDTEFGTDSSQNMSAYEAARLKLEKQLQGPAPAYTPATDGALLPPEKAIYEPNPATGQPRTLQLSPTPSTTSPSEGGSNLISAPLPSPMTPGFDANGPIMAVNVPVSPTNDGSSLSLISPIAPSSDSQTNDSTAMGHFNREPSSASDSLPSTPQPRIVQRTPIDSSNIVFLGPLPENVRFSRHEPPRLAINQGGEDDTTTKELHDGQRRGTLDSLGSNFTVEEEEWKAGNMNEQMNLVIHGSFADLQSTRPAAEPGTPHSQERIDASMELVHVPQLAEQRYSWEEER